MTAARGIIHHGQIRAFFFSYYCPLFFGFLSCLYDLPYVPSIGSYASCICDIRSCVFEDMGRLAGLLCREIRRRCISRFPCLSKAPLAVKSGTLSICSGENTVTHFSTPLKPPVLPCPRAASPISYLPYRQPASRNARPAETGRSAPRSRPRRRRRWPSRSGRARR